MILTKPQAKAVYDAMCALNNVGASFDELFISDSYPRIKFIRFQWNGGYGVSYNGDTKENYGSESDFAKAYGVE